MHIEKHFDVKRAPAEAVQLVANDETLLTLFPDAESEIVSSEGDRRTVRTHYRLLGQEGSATFHFTFLPDAVRFEKVCDGRVWRELKGEVEVEERGDGTRISLEMEGRTKPFVPEFTIKAPMQDQLDAMARALRERLQDEV